MELFRENFLSWKTLLILKTHMITIVFTLHLLSMPKVWSSNYFPKLKVFVTLRLFSLAINSPGGAPVTPSC